MNNQTIDPSSIRARKARLAGAIGKTGHTLLIVISIILAVVSVAAFIAKVSIIPFVALALAVLGYIIATWWKYDLNPLPIDRSLGVAGQLHGEVLRPLNMKTLASPSTIWDALRGHWQSRFILNHLFLPPEALTQTINQDPNALDAIWNTAAQLADEQSSEMIEVGHVVGAIMLNSPVFSNVLIQQKMRPEDIRAVVDWLGRGVNMIDNRVDYGGIGRDWANGYTPNLDRFGHNISLSIEKHGTHFGWLSKSQTVQAMRNTFSQGASAIALIGDAGSGKTSHVYALAQSLLSEAKDPRLEHRQIVSLNASMIISSATRPGELEYIVGTLLGESAHAGHIILFFDDAELFFSQGAGMFDASKILLPALQSRAIQVVMAFTSHGWQSLKSSNATVANLMTPIMLPEPPESDVMRVLEDSALGFEHKNKVLITYDALREAYRLSGRYETEIAYPGKAINLLEQSVSQAIQGVVTARSVQQAIEQSKGVKVTEASGAESDKLLNLEDEIHQRIINQTHAVSVVSNALRRARAGVANPKRPVGSFLFLGPTGVGKTELAKAISAIYYGAEATMTRLDMSEFQQPEDVSRLLSDGTSESGSLIMSVRKQPFGVVLLDEIEKAHPNILNLLLQLLDEGQLTDTGGRMASFKDCIIICTSNAGADTIREKIASGQNIESLTSELTDQLISSGEFRPELLNRFDEMVVFRPLTQPELLQVVALMIKDVNSTLSPQNISVELTNAAMESIVAIGYDPRLGARPMRRAVQRSVEDAIAQKILRSEVRPGDHIVLDAHDLAT